MSAKEKELMPFQEKLDQLQAQSKLFKSEIGLLMNRAASAEENRQKVIKELEEAAQAVENTVCYLFCYFFMHTEKRYYKC